MLTLAMIFGDHMVLQRRKPIPIWGKALPGTVVTGTLDGVSSAGLTGSDGHWRLYLPAMEAGGPYRLEISGKDESLVLEDVRLGEVWLAGGQSNMEMSLRDSQDGAQAVAGSTNPNIRFYNVPKCAVLDETQIGHWQVCGPDTTGDMSAVAWYFACQIAETQNVAVGIVDCYWGGTSISCWMSRAQLERTRAGQAYIDRYAALVGDKTDEQYAQEMAVYNRDYQAWCDRIDAYRTAHPGVSWEVLNQECGLCPWPQPAGNQSPFRPAGLYGTMLQRVCPYGLRGFLYYQGEEDQEYYASYDEMMTLLIDQWRSDWGDDELPFLFVQLPMYCSKEDADLHRDSKNWAMMRDQQRKVCRTVRNTGMAVLTDCGEFDNIHPLDKRTVGFRLALQARKKVYGESVLADAPIFLDARAEGRRIIVRFRHTGGFLMVRGETLQGFELAGQDGMFFPATGKVGIDIVVLESESVPEPQYVRYAWTNYGPASLCGASGLPAAPFRTDHFPIR